MLNPPPANSPLADRLAMTREEIRASVAAEGKGPRAAIAKAILRLLETLMALLADFAAGKFAPVVAGEEAPREDRGSRPRGSVPLRGTAMRRMRRAPHPHPDWSASRPNPPLKRERGKKRAALAVPLARGTRFAARRAW